MSRNSISFQWPRRIALASVLEERSIDLECVVVDDEFDWQDDGHLRPPLTDTVIYEMHVRGFTRHASSGVAHPGTFSGVVEKIPYLKALGVTAVELMPVTEFEECDNPRSNLLTGEPLPVAAVMVPVKVCAKVAPAGTSTSTR